MSIKVPENIAIRNPHVNRLVAQEVQRGAGRNPTEAAENLILEAIAHRAAERAREEASKPQKREPEAVAA